MARKDLIKKLKKKYPKLTKSELEIILTSFSNSIEKALIAGRKVELRGFGIFSKKRLNQKYSARNPKTGEIIYVPEKNKVRFKPSKKLKDFINK